jgi:hypothetical protein
MFNTGLHAELEDCTFTQRYRTDQVNVAWRIKRFASFFLLFLAPFNLKNKKLNVMSSFIAFNFSYLFSIYLILELIYWRKSKHSICRPWIESEAEFHRRGVSGNKNFYFSLDRAFHIDIYSFIFGIRDRFLFKITYRRWYGWSLSRKEDKSDWIDLITATFFLG